LIITQKGRDGDEGVGGMVFFLRSILIRREEGEKKRRERKGEKEKKSKCHQKSRRHCGKERDAKAVYKA